MQSSKIGQTLATALEVHAQRRPNEIAFVREGSEVTWRELDARSNRVANGLIAEGTGLGSRVSYLGKNSERYFDVLFGASKAGCVLVPINWRLAPPEVRFILDDSEAVALFVDREFLPLIEKVMGELNHLRLVVVVDGDESGDLSKLSKPSLDVWEKAQKNDRPPRNSDRDDIILQLYTSGTTGTPKGAELSNRFFYEADKIMRSIEGGVYEWEVDDVGLIPTPLFHMSGIIFAVLALTTGCKSILLQEFDPEKVLTLVGKEPIRVLPTVPAMVQILLDHPLAKTTDFSRLSHFSYGASPMPPALLRRAMEVAGCGFFQGYGMTESTVVTALPPADHTIEGNKRMASVGKPLPGVDLRIVDENDKDVPIGEVGEIIFRSPVLLDRYWKREAETAKAMRGGFFHTGDAAYQDEDGYVYLKDRIKDMIISGGENVYPAEVEHALYEHPSVQEIAVVGVPDERWGEVPKAFIVLRPGSSFDIDEMKQFAAERIAKYKVPKHYETLEELPKTATGKVLRRELRLNNLAEPAG